MNKINILFCFDLNYWKKAIVTITQMLTKTNPNNFYNIYCIIDKEPNFSFKQIIKKVYKLDNYEIIFKIANHDFDNVDSHAWSTVVLWRLQTPKIIQEDKILSFDVDIVFREDPALMFNIDINTHMAGCIDLMSAEYLIGGGHHKHKEFFEDIGINNVKNYINFGCVLINLKKMRNDNMYEKFISESKKNYYFPEQSVFNVLCLKTILDPSFSIFNYKFQYLRPKILEIYGKTKKEMKAVIKNVKYVHFNLPKPWSKICIGNFKLRREWLNTNMVFFGKKSV